MEALRQHFLADARLPEEQYDDVVVSNPVDEGHDGLHRVTEPDPSVFPGSRSRRDTPRTNQNDELAHLGHHARIEPGASGWRQALTSKLGSVLAPEIGDEERRRLDVDGGVFARYRRMIDAHIDSFTAPNYESTLGRKRHVEGNPPAENAEDRLRTLGGRLERFVRGAARRKGIVVGAAHAALGARFGRLLQRGLRFKRLCNLRLALRAHNAGSTRKIPTFP